MLSYLLFVVSMMNSGFVNKNLDSKLTGEGMSGETTGGLVVVMGPVMNLRVADVRVYPVGGDMPEIVRKGSLFEGFSHNRLYAIRYGK